VLQVAAVLVMEVALRAAQPEARQAAQRVQLRAVPTITVVFQTASSRQSWVRTMTKRWLAATTRQGLALEIPQAAQLQVARRPRRAVPRVALLQVARPPVAQPPVARPLAALVAQREQAEPPVQALELELAALPALVNRFLTKSLL
jgi:hypothetical protein